MKLSIHARSHKIGDKYHPSIIVEDDSGKPRALYWPNITCTSPEQACTRAQQAIQDVQAAATEVLDGWNTYPC